MFYSRASTPASRGPFRGSETVIPPVVRSRAGRNRRESVEKRMTPDQCDTNVLPRRRREALRFKLTRHLPVAVADLGVTESADLWKSGKLPVGRVNLVGIGRNTRKVTLRVAGRGASEPFESDRRLARAGPRIELKRGIFKRIRSVPISGRRSRGAISGFPVRYVREADNA